MFLNMFLAVLPTAIILFVVLKFDRFEKEPTPLLIILFVVGALTVIPAIILENLVPVAPENLYGFFNIFLYALLGVALIEEAVKFFAVKLYAYNKPSYNEIYDGIIYCVMVSLGFATVENIFYVIQYGTSTAIIRALTAVPAHAMFAITMGYYMSLGKVAVRRAGYYKFMSLFMPIMIHALYDFILFVNFDFVMLIFIPYVIIMYIRSIQLIRKTNDIQPFK